MLQEKAAYYTMELSSFSMVISNQVAKKVTANIFGGSHLGHPFGPGRNRVRDHPLMMSDNF